MSKMTTEYEVNELADESDEYYRHGYRGFDKVEAYSSLKYMRDFYGPYGRVFVMKTRQVSAWEVEES